MLVRQNITLPMATNFSEETNLFSTGAQMPVTIQHDDSDSDSNVSSEDLPIYTDLLSVQTSTGAAGEVKLELRNVIRTRREARGLDGVPYLEPKRPKLEVLTFEEEEKRRIRRERNKIAAFKCRQRRKEHVQHLQAESDVLSAERSSLEREIAALKAQKEQLTQMVQSHKCVLRDGESKECQDNKSEAKSPQTCSSEVAKSSDSASPPSSVDSVKV